MATDRYCSGPGLMDLAVLMPSGKWVRIANGRVLPESVWSTWEPLVPWSEVPTLIAQAEEKGYNRGLDDGMDAMKGVRRAEPEKLPPAVQRRSLLEQFGQHHDGLTMREAAEKANLLGNPGYTSRFGSDLIKHGLVASTGGRRSGAQVLAITEMGRDELRSPT